MEDVLDDYLHIFTFQKLITEYKDPSLEIFKAIATNNVTTYTRLAADEKLLKSVDEFQNTLLHAAVYFSRESILDHLLSLETIPVNSKNSRKWTPLSVAVVTENTSAVVKLIKAKADPEIPDGSGKTPFDMAVSRNIDIAICLLANCENLFEKLWELEKYNFGSPLLHRAIAFYDDGVRVCELLVKAGADVNARNFDHKTFLHLAAEKEDPSLVQLVIRSGALVNARDKYLDRPLHIAARKGDHETAAILIDAGADVNVRNREEETPLHLAAKTSDKIVSLLIQNNCEVNAVDDHKQTALHYAVRHEKVESVRSLLQAKATINMMRDLKIASPLHLAIENACIMLMLIQNGGDVDEEDNSECTPLHNAVDYNSTEVAHMLLYYGADTSFKTRFNTTAFMLALRCSNHHLQETLFRYETDFTTVNNHGENMLCYAVTCTSPVTLGVLHSGMDFFCASSYPGARSILSFLLLKGNVGLFRYIVESHKIQDVIEYIGAIRTAYPLSDNEPDERIICVMIEIINRRFTREMVYELVYVLLSNGYEPDELEAIEVFRTFGGCALSNLLLELDLRPAAGLENHLLSNIWMKVWIPVHQIISDYVEESKDVGTYAQLSSAASNVKSILPFCVHNGLFLWFKQKASANNYHLEDDLLIRLNSNVPTLLELARNEFRHALCLKNHIRRSYHFYKAVQSMRIPFKIKDIILIKTPIY